MAFIPPPASPLTSSSNRPAPASFQFQPVFPTYLQRLLCGLVSTLFTALGFCLGPFPSYSACFVSWPLSWLQRLLAGLAPILVAALAVWLGLFPAYSACLAAWPLSLLQRLLCGLASSCFQRLPCGLAPILVAALAVWLGLFPVYSAVWLGACAIFRACCGFGFQASYNACCVARSLFCFPARPVRPCSQSPAPISPLIPTHPGLPANSLPSSYPSTSLQFPHSLTPAPQLPALANPPSVQLPNPPQLQAPQLFHPAPIPAPQPATSPPSPPPKYCPPHFLLCLSDMSS